MSNKNPYSPETPEYQLFVNMVSQEQLVGTYIKDSERYLELSNKAREKAELYRNALIKLGYRD